jgi:hypothetical protein
MRRGQSRMGRPPGLFQRQMATAPMTAAAQVPGDHLGTVVGSTCSAESALTVGHP